MKKIAILKAHSVIRDMIVTTLQQELINSEIYTYGPDDLKVNDNIGSKADMVIIDLDINLDIHHLIECYKTEGKKVVVWTPTTTNPALPCLFKLGLHGYFYNGMEKEELVHAIESIFNDKVYVDKELAPVLLDEYISTVSQEPKRPCDMFTNREWEVIELLVKGYSNEKIGKHLFISDKTVKNYVNSILKKLQLPDRTNVVLHAIKNNWFYI
ncbi:response regulator transcription factor [Aquibacillus koreensis]|uniref:Response regulator transcription factor n=1 Tax=Aquibacillus koreensis TaxID=279446 RepID=A0A9X4AIY4_9BACI|nr:response regulator transcription factor [Aquibacillus koreensis]MCT2534614.1 response regulator transcription factor [Aquibacillus koreensis]MDC3419798.1 response regulator transcription factor [Aquibacillus koreensis]